MYMGMRKYQSVEKVEVVSPKVISEKLAKVGATNAKSLTDKERSQTHLLDR